ncbi:MAG: BREX-3 system P-loop-containing protein BrxF [Deltaproteobacteria bacterium]|nr:BREX-3 system P-loop-containing protein BrxF [Deltaproteobacteria bacterium]
MADPFADQVIKEIGQAGGLYRRLILLVGPAGSGKTKALQEVHNRQGVPLINVNLELTRRMLDLTGKQRALQVPKLLGDIIDKADGDIVLLDNIEILFDILLKLDPLRLLQNISRLKTIVAAWNGSIDKEQITYAMPDHPEYRRYPIRDFLVVNMEAKT